MNKNLKGFLFLLKPYKKEVSFAFLATILTNLLGLAFPWVIKLLVDEVLVKKDILLINRLAVILLVVFALKFFFGFIREYLFSSTGENVICDLRSRLYWHLHKLSVNYLENTPVGSIISGIIGDVESIRKFLFGGAIDFVYSFLNFFFVLTILFVLDFKLTLVSLLFMPVFAIVFFKLTPRLKKKQEFVRAKYAGLTARLNEVFSGIRIVCGFAREEHEAAQFNSKQKEIFNASLASEKLGILLWMMSEFFSSLGLVTLIWFGAREVFSGRISPGTLLAVYSYLGMLFFPVIKMVVINNYYQEAAVSFERINRILDEKPKITESKHPVRLPEIKGNIRFSEVTFSYDNHSQALSGINLEVRESQVIALVGKSGAGKTTLINLLLRFYDPNEGGIFIDGYNLKELDLKSYRSHIAMVLQDDYLFSGTVAENISYGRPGASRFDVKRVALLANADQFIIELPDGYNTQVGERGVKLSYGQRQRLSIARAILRNPAVLILDEATSSVDSETERLIIEGAYKNLMAGRTTFVIAHRLSTIAYADNIIFIDRGRITEAGRHFELLEKKGQYWRMWLEQTQSVPLAQII
ncbi:MAG: ABC transporter ATP-binding protein [Candidatus Omnitrophica bacterium]|nr:ABC transporter ATP-binding protein [Candidatus Omnitrophota bacterium]